MLRPRGSNLLGNDTVFAEETTDESVGEQNDRKLPKVDRFSLLKLSNKSLNTLKIIDLLGENIEEHEVDLLLRDLDTSILRRRLIDIIELIDNHGGNNSYTEHYYEYLGRDSKAEPTARSLTIEDIKPHIKEFWKKRDKSMKEDAPTFIARVYADFIGNGLNRAHLKLDRELYKALDNWLTTHKEGLPDWLNLPNKNKSHKHLPPPTAEEVEIWRRVGAHKALESKKRTG